MVKNHGALCQPGAACTLWKLYCSQRPPSGLQLDDIRRWSSKTLNSGTGLEICMRDSSSRGPESAQLHTESPATHILPWVNLTQIVAAFQRCSAAAGPPQSSRSNIANQVTQRFNDIQTTMYSRYDSRGIKTQSIEIVQYNFFILTLLCYRWVDKF